MARRRNPFETLLVSTHGAWLLVGLFLLGEIWLLPLLPTQDGPLHVYIGYLLNRLADVDAGAAAQFFERNPAFEPNVAVHHLLAVLLEVFQPDAAERIALSLYALLFVFGARYAMRAVAPDADARGLLLVPFALGYFLHMGFYNYCLGTALFLWSFGYWLRHCAERRVSRYAGMLALVTITTMTHLFALILLAVVVGCTRFGRLLLELRSQPRAKIRDFLLDTCWILVAFLPGIVAVLDFFGRYAITDVGSASRGRAYLAEQLLTGLPLYSFSELELWAALPLLATMAVLGVHRGVQLLVRRRVRPADALVLPLLALTVLYFTNDLTTRDVPTWQRLLPFLNFVYLLWIAAGELGRRTARGVAVVAVLATVLLAGARLLSYARFIGPMQEYMAAAERIEPGTAFLAVHFDRPGREQRRRTGLDPANPFRHLSARIAVQRDAIDLRSSIISRECYGYFPVVYREDRDPYALLGMWIEDLPPPIRFADYDRSGHPIDFVLAWRMPAESRDEKVLSLRAQLDSAYELIWQSSGAGHARLYRRRLR